MTAGSSPTVADSSTTVGGAPRDGRRSYSASAAFTSSARRKRAFFSRSSFGPSASRRNVRRM